MKYLSKLLLILVALVATTVAVPAIATVPVEAQANASRRAACEGVALTGGSCDTPGNGEPTVQRTIRIAINILSFVVGVISVIMIIVGGLKYITSAGDSNSINSAKNTILYAVIGLVVVAMAQVVVRFVINQVT